MWWRRIERVFSEPHRTLISDQIDIREMVPKIITNFNILYENVKTMWMCLAYELGAIDGGINFFFFFIHHTFYLVNTRMSNESE